MANGAIAYYRDGAWEAITPRPGFLAFAIDTGIVHFYNGSAWTAFSVIVSLAIASGQRLDVSAGKLTLPINATAESIEGALRWDFTLKALAHHNGQRELYAPRGWQPYAYAIGGSASLVATTALTLAANGGALACPVVADGHMLLQSLVLRSTDTTLARSAEWRLYAQRLNNGNAGENALDEVAGANGAFSFTAAAASNQTSAPSGAPIYLAPGLYWLVIRNTHATNTFGLGTAAAGTMALTTGKTKTLGSALGATLDLVAATWAATTGIAGVCLRGRVFGETAAY